MTDNCTNGPLALIEKNNHIESLLKKLDTVNKRNQQIVKIQKLTITMEANLEHCKLKNELELLNNQIKQEKEKLINQDIQHKKDIKNEVELATLKAKPKIIHSPLPIIHFSSFYGSKILNYQQKIQLNAWKTGQWALLFSASTHGDSAAIFHAQCNHKAGTYVVVKVGSYVFGGYTPSSWTSTNGYANTNNLSFLFTLINPYGHAPTKIPCIIGANGILNSPNYGPRFGPGALILTSNCRSNRNSSCGITGVFYANTLGMGANTFTGSSNFQVTDYEVFAVV